jgi:AcrR family transcriptional regulator
MQGARRHERQCTRDQRGSVDFVVSHRHAPFLRRGGRYCARDGPGRPRDHFPDNQGAFVQDRLVIPGATDDPRGRRTRDELAWALIALMHERAYDDIGVGDICTKAGHGRSTFYSHFADKDEMFVRHLVVFAEHLGKQLGWDGASGGYRFAFAALLDHVRQMRPVFESLSRSRKLELVIKIWQNNFAAGFEQCIRATRAASIGGAPAAMPADLLAQHIAGTMLNLLMWWMEHGYPIEPRAMEENFHRLIDGQR